MIEVQDLAASYSEKGSKKIVFENLFFEVSSGVPLSVIGPSGCGKTTLLYLLSGLKKPEKGEILFRGERLNGHRREIALVLQHYGLLPWKTVFQNASLGLRIRGFSKKETKKTVLPILRELTIDHLLDRFPNQLSGGEKQRVAIARALALKPSLLLLDEPFSSLDAFTREHLQNLILNICRQRELALVHVTHSIEEAVFLGEKALVMNEGGYDLLSINGVGMAERDSEYRKNDLFHQYCNLLRGYLKR
ncbi:MAG: ATP-binding cassette domain-containing protein [Thermodesulfobacteriota bacterium]|nr:ATP-binding cassette domain-containing protein [Thermodesulfobacteriota bacterium]